MHGVARYKRNSYRVQSLGRKRVQRETEERYRKGFR
jgi:hypothetical protein